MSLDAIEHIVVLVMENRSFDHLLAYRSNTNMDPSLKLRAPRFSPGPHHTYEHVARQLTRRSWA